ncbi:carboxypeptidase regulatory-like domain-containing protein [Lutibacter citreus]|uniref:carboxypeptidase regulatory-like domain-containing protein n=1 Tax=Lutibacter citreus TaxID=2138210 RepID=UPI000DBE68CB|nr:carboxypeptidase regulatory-like domain-containing protein [Lutibacter citreus]
MKYLNKIKPLYFILLFINICFSQTSDLVTINSKTKLKILKPGEHYTILFEVKNNSNSSIKLDFDYILPENFNPILKFKTKTIPSFGKKNVLFTFSVGKYCKASDYSIEFIAKKNNQTTAKYKLKFQVEKTFNISINPIKSPNYLRFEKEFSCEYLIINKGNSKEKINLESYRSLTVKPSIVTLSPDSTAIIKVTQAVPFSPFSKSIALNVLSAEIISSGAQFSNRIPVTVYPNSKKKPDLYERFPISVSTVYNNLKGLDTVNTFKFNISGAGYLDKEKNNYLSILYSGPNQPELIRFGEYDQYNLTYKSKKIELLAGHISYSLSNLTETSRNGLGGIFKYNFPKSNISVFYLEPRFTDKISTSYGGDFQWFTSEKSLIKLGFINRSILEDEQSLQSQIYRLATENNLKNIKLNGEIAFETNELTNGFAASLDAYYNNNKFQWGNSLQFSDKNFKGYLRDSRQLISNISYQLSNKINTQLNATYQSLNPEQDDIIYNSSPLLTSYRGKISLKLNKSNRIKFGATYRNKEDRLYPKKFHFEEKLLNLNYSNQKMNRYSLYIYNSYGTTKNFLIENSSPSLAFYSSVDLSVSLFQDFSIGAFANYEYTNRNSFDGEIQSSLYYGGSLQYQLRDKLGINLFYRSDYAVDELEADAQSFLEAQLNYQFNRNQKLSFSASQSSLPTQNNALKKELFISASYSFIINAPISKDKTRGTIKGKITSTDNDNLEGILVSLENNASVTNKKGEFIFYNLTPGIHSINIAQSSLPNNKIIVENTPYAIDVAPNKDSFIEFNLGKTGSLSGKLILKKLNTVRSNKFDKKLPRIIVKIYNKDNKYLTQTNEKGEFNFLKLAPGEWTVELLVKPLLSDFTFTPIKKNIFIKPDEDLFVKFNASIKNRRLKKSKKTFKL